MMVTTSTRVRKRSGRIETRRIPTSSSHQVPRRAEHVFWNFCHKSQCTCPETDHYETRLPVQRQATTYGQGNEWAGKILSLRLAPLALEGTPNSPSWGVSFPECHAAEGPAAQGNGDANCRGPHVLLCHPNSIPGTGRASKSGHTRWLNSSVLRYR